MIGFADVIEGLENIPTDKEPLDTESKRKNRMMNKTAFFALTALMDSQTNKDIIFESVTKDISRGDSRLSWTRLNNKYTIDNSIYETQLQNKFLNCCLTPNDNPRDWLAQMERMKNQVIKSKSMKIKDKGFRERLIENLPASQYAILKLNLLTMNDKGMTTDECKSQILNYHHIMESKVQNKIDQTLNVYNEPETPNKKSKEENYEERSSSILCQNCPNTPQHLASKCWKNKTCRKCLQKVHISYRCPLNSTTNKYDRETTCYKQKDALIVIETITMNRDVIRNLLINSRLIIILKITEDKISKRMMI